VKKNAGRFTSAPSRGQVATLTLLRSPPTSITRYGSSSQFGAGAVGEELVIA
jgi:hypothetical protein